MIFKRAMRLLAVSAALAAVLCPTTVVADWQSMSSAEQSGPGTIYGFGQNSKGACSYGSNFAGTTGLPWSSAPAGASDGGTGLAATFIALNAPQFELTASCGTCIWFRGTGDGIGVEARRISTDWQYGMVDNICPECKKGALDLARSFSVGDGIWTVEWHAVPCNVGDSLLYYTFTAADAYYFNLVISNTRVPVADVAVVIEGRRVSLTRTTNNNWAYHNSQGSYTFPMEITITPVCGEAVTDVIQSTKAGFGGVQFGEAGCSSLGNPTSGGSGGGSSGSSSSGSVSTEATSVQRVASPRHLDTQKATSEARLLAPTSPPTSEPTATPTTAPTAEPTAEPTTEPTAAPTAAPTTEPTTEPTAEPTAALSAERRAIVTSAPTAEPTAQPTAAPTPESTLAPTAVPTAEPPAQPTPKAQLLVESATAAPTAEPDVVPVSRADATKFKATTDVGDRELFGGALSDATDKAVLPPWYQCGDTSGLYPGIDCGGKDWNCVYVNEFYWQCRDDGGGPSTQGRRLAAAPRRILRH